MGAPRFFCQSETFVDEVVATLKQISHKRDPQWLTDPQTVELGIDLTNFMKPLPAILVSLELGQHEPIMAPKMAGDIAFTLHFLIIVDIANHGILPMRIESDMRKALIANKKLAQMVYGPWAQSRSGFHTDAMRAYPGLGIVDSQYVGKFRFDEDTL